MRQTLTVSIGAFATFILILSPILGMAAQRAITAESLEKAYISRVTYIETRTAYLNQQFTIEMETLEDACSKRFPRVTCSELGNEKTQAIETELKELQFEKKAVVASYSLMKEALK